jgi:hypothetical protein
MATAIARVRRLSNCIGDMTSLSSFMDSVCLCKVATRLTACHGSLLGDLDVKARHRDHPDHRQSDDPRLQGVGAHALLKLPQSEIINRQGAKNAKTG